MTHFRLFQTERFCRQQFADNNFCFHVNGRKFSTRVENTKGKGEIACYEQFLLFPQCFLNTCATDIYKQGLVWERFKDEIINYSGSK